MSGAQGSQAYARALAKAGVLTDEESAKIQQGLVDVGKEWEAAKFEVGLEPLRQGVLEMLPSIVTCIPMFTCVKHPCRHVWQKMDRHDYHDLCACCIWVH